MNDGYSEELELIMNMYRNGKITGEQKDGLIAALEKRSGKREETDCKKIVFRVITEKRNADAAEIVRVLSCVSGVETVTFDERNSLATVIGGFDVDGLIAAAKEGEIRLRVRDIDINYEPEPKPEKVEPKVSNERAPSNAVELERESESVVHDAEVEPDATEYVVEERDENEYECEIDEDDEDDDFDEYDYDEDDEDDECDYDDYEYDDDDDDETDDSADELDGEKTRGNDDFERDDEVKINIDDSRSLSEFLKGLGAKISDAFDKGIKAADEAGKKIADFADNVVIKTCDLGRGSVIIKSKPERFEEPYSQMTAAVKIVTAESVNAFSGDPENVKIECKGRLPDDMYSALCALIDSRFTGKYKYVNDSVVLKLSVRPKKQDD